jgi:hypothetical protein
MARDETHGFRRHNRSECVSAHAKQWLKQLSGQEPQITTKHQPASKKWGPERVFFAVPHYNRASIHEARLQSIANQACRNLEPIALDDCANDHSVAAIKSLF